MNLDHRITVQSKSVTRAANGEEIITWGTFATLWAKVEPIRGREFFAAAQSQSAIDYRVTVHYRTDINRTMRIIFGTQTLEIGSEPINVKSANRWLELMCVAIDG